MLKINYWKLLISIVVCQLAGFIGSLFTSTSVSDWYITLNKPGFTPPGSVISTVWITLFVLMGISLYLVWMEGIKKSKTALIWFGIQLFLNIMWSALFFGLKSPLFAFIEIILLWAAILITIIKFYSISKPAAYLLVPYILWVSFAAFLNFSIFYINI